MYYYITTPTHMYYCSTTPKYHKQMRVASSYYFFRGVPPLYTDTQMLIPQGETQFLTSFCLQKPPANLGADKFTYKRDWSHFHTCKLGVFLSTTVRN